MSAPSFRAPTRGAPTSPARVAYRKVVNRVMLTLATLAAVAAMGALLLVLLYLLVHGLRSGNLRMLTQGPTPIGVPGGGIPFGDLVE